MSIKTFRHKPLEVQAVRIEKGVGIPGVTWSKFYDGTAHVEMRRGQRVAREGDWLICSKWGWDKVMTDEEFKNKYEEKV